MGSSWRKRLKRCRRQAVDEDWDAMKRGLESVLGDRGGRRFIWGLVSMCGVWHNAYDELPSRTNFRLGEQNIGQKVLAMITELDNDMWLDMRREYQMEAEGARRSND